MAEGVFVLKAKLQAELKNHGKICVDTLVNNDIKTETDVTKETLYGLRSVRRVGVGCRQARFAGCFR